MQPHFIGEVIVEQLRDKWVLHEPLTYIGAVRVTAPAGYLTDFASVPWPLRPLLPADDYRYAAAAVIHDLLYGKHGVGEWYAIPISRALADRVLLEAAESLGCPAPRRWALYLGVRLGGRWAWQGGPERDRRHRACWQAHQAAHAALLATGAAGTKKGEPGP